ncbi:MAG: protein kinase [Acidobacteria bacterium]|nr:protein kinase [Acidobacteriota bacterium]
MRDESPALRASAPNWVGRRLGKFVVEAFLGQGGMGQVYRARDTVLGREVALKIVPEGSDEGVLRLTLEAKALARVDHPGICHVHEVSEDHGRPFIAMQLIQGRSLERMSGDLGPREKVAMIREVAEAMHFAHGHGVIHRDLKPSNILVDESTDPPRPVVVDFGLVHLVQGPGLTRTGATLGTPAFMSPEQAQGDAARVDRRSDVFSLGATLYALLLGDSPFQASTSIETMRRLMEEEPPPPRKRDPSLPRDLETILLRCLEKIPARRYDTAKALAEDLDRFLSGEPIEARRDSRFTRVFRRARKNRPAMILAGSGLVALLAMGGWFLWIRHEDGRRAERLRAFTEEVERQDGRMRAAMLLPLHDLHADEAEVRTWMDTVRRGDRLDEPPVDFALGRGHLLLREYGEARARLQRAWDRGLRGPEVAIPLARALGALYQEGRMDLAIEEDPAKRKLIEDRLDRELRDPVVELIRASTVQRPAQRAYQAGLIAYYEQNFPESLVRCQEAEALDPGLFEAWELEGSTWFASGDSKARAGDLASATRDWSKAELAFRRALDMARSSPDLLAKMGELERHRAQFLGQNKDQPAQEAGYLRAIEVQERALAADPLNLKAHLERTRAWLLLGYGREDRGRDPSGAYAGALRAVREGLVRKPRDPELQAYEGTALLVASEYARLHGDPDSLRLRREAESAFGKARDLAPLNYTYLDEYIWMLVALAQERLDRGQDLESVAREAWEQVGPRLIASGFGAYDAHFALCQILSLQGRALASHGADPTAAFAEALRHGQQAYWMNPGNTNICDAVGRALLWRAEFARSRGDRVAALADAKEAVRMLKEALGRQPMKLGHHLVLGSLFRLEAELALDRNEDPANPIQESEASFRKALELDPSQQEVLAGWARLQAVKSRIPLRAEQAL